MKLGRLIALDRTENLLHAEKGLRVELLLDGPLPENLRQWQQPADGEEVKLKLENYEQLAFVLQTLKYAEVEVKHMALPETDLEEVFVKMMHK